MSEKIPSMKAMLLSLYVHGAAIGVLSYDNPHFVSGQVDNADIKYLQGMFKSLIRKNTSNMTDMVLRQVSKTGDRYGSGSACGNFSFDKLKRWSGIDMNEKEGVVCIGYTYSVYPYVNDKSLVYVQMIIVAKIFVGRKTFTLEPVYITEGNIKFQIPEKV